MLVQGTSVGLRAGSVCCGWRAYLVMLLHELWEVLPHKLGVDWPIDHHVCNVYPCEYMASSAASYWLTGQSEQRRAERKWQLWRQVPRPTLCCKLLVCGLGECTLAMHASAECRKARRPTNAGGRPREDEGALAHSFPNSKPQPPQPPRNRQAQEPRPLPYPLPCSHAWHHFTRQQEGGERGELPHLPQHTTATTLRGRSLLVPTRLLAVNVEEGVV